MKLSVFMPTIRVDLLNKWYQSLLTACGDIDFEVVTCGPFKPPEELLNLENFKWIEDFGCPTRAAQIAASNCVGELLYHTVDDVLFYPNELSNESKRIDLNNDEIVAMRYREGEGQAGELFPSYYWYSDLAYKDFGGVKGVWGSCVHFLMKRDLFLEFGGFDCSFEYLNHSTHDLLYRLQNTKPVKYVLSNNEICTADWQPETTGDHAPIHYAQTEHDQFLFRGMWDTLNRQGSVNLHNWKSVPPIWGRRREAISDLDITKKKEVVKKKAVKKKTKGTSK